MSRDGLDFSDGAQPPLDAHPDLDYNAYAPQPAHLQRNKTERRRLQGLQRSNTASSKPVVPYEPKTLKEKWDLWMINEGGKRLFFCRLGLPPPPRRHLWSVQLWIEG